MDRWPSVTCLLVACCAIAAQTRASEPSAHGIVDVGVVDVSEGGGSDDIRLSDEHSDSHHRLLACADDGPVGWLQFDSARGVYRRPAAEPAVGAASVHAWLVPRDILARVSGGWPDAVPHFAAMDAVAPGDRGGWIRAAPGVEIAAGQCWWLRVDGQPVARLDTAFADGRLAYGRLTALAAESQGLIAPGAVLERWDTGKPDRYRSAVCNAAEGADVWIAGTPHLVASGQRVVFWRGGRVVGRGTLARADGRFGYIARSPASDAGSIRIGDEAVVEPVGGAGLRAGRVFSEAAGEALVDVGEIDGLAPGDSGSLLRGGKVIGQATVTRLQSSYARIETSGATPRAGDDVEFGLLPAPLREATIEAVADGSMFVARCEGDWPVGVVCAVRDASGVVGAALTVEARDGRIVGFAIDGATRRTLRAGDRLTDR